MEAILKLFISPSGAIFVFLFMGTILFFIRRNGKTGRGFLVTGACLFIIFGFGPSGFWLLGNLEGQYPPLRDLETLENGGTILLLAGYAEKDPHVDPNSQVNFASAFRVMEGIRILAVHPDKQIIISGYGHVPGIMKSLMEKMGVQRDKVFVDAYSGNTYMSGVNNLNRLKGKSFILVTSAGHMPRAMAVFKKLGMNPIPAPTNYLSKKDYVVTTYLPSPQNLQRSDLAVHEYLALAWYRLTNRI